MNATQLTSARSIHEHVAFTDVLCGSSLLSPGSNMLLEWETQHSKLLVGGKHMPQYFETCEWKIAVKFVRMNLCVSILKGYWHWLYGSLTAGRTDNLYTSVLVL